MNASMLFVVDGISKNYKGLFWSPEAWRKNISLLRNIASNGLHIM
jgi:uncharacterized protein YjeT (DUF2065 family)